MSVLSEGVCGGAGEEGLFVMGGRGGGGVERVL